MHSEGIEFRSCAGFGAALALASLPLFLIPMHLPPPWSYFAMMPLALPVGYVLFRMHRAQMCRFRLNGSIHKALDDSDPQQVALILDSPYDIWLGRGREIRRCLMTEIVEWPAQLVEVLTPARRRKLVNLISELYGQSKDDEDYRFISALVPILVAAGDSSDRRYLLSIGRLYCGSEQQKAVRQMIRDNVEAKDARPDLLRAASAPVDRDLLHTLDESVINRESELLRAGECHLAQHSDSGGGAPADG